MGVLGVCRQTPVKAVARDAESRRAVGPGDPTLGQVLRRLVTKDRELGVDVEDIQRPGETVAIADRFFSPLETAELLRQPMHKQRDRFFDYWTLKEAYIKARGMGLAIPLDHFSYHLENPQAIRISFAPQLPDNPARWQFSLRTLAGRHRIATAVERRPDEAPVEIQMMKCVPFER